MATTPAIDYDALAQQHGAAIDYDALASQHGGSTDTASPGLLDKANEYAGKALSAAGLPTSLGNVPDWFRHLTGQHPQSEPFWAPIRKAIQNPTEENLVAAVPFIGPSSVAMAKDVREGDYGGAAATLAGTVGGVVAPTKAPEIAAGLSDATQAVKDVPGNLVEAAKTGLRDETGKLKSSVKSVAQAGGMLVGAAPGLTHGNVPAAVAGGAAGYKLAPGVVDWLTPEREPSISKAVPLSQSPNYPALQAARRAAIKQAAENAAPSKVQAPAEAAVESEGRPATWTNDYVTQRAAKGDVQAIQQARLRGLKLPPNAGMVADKGATMTPTMNTPKSVTMFDAEGKPINGTESQAQPGIRIENAMGIRWAVSSDGKYRVSVPNSLPDNLIESYAAPRLSMQAQQHAVLGR